MTLYKAVLLLLAVLPVILILLVVYYKDKNKEPTALLLSLFFSGIASCFLVLIISRIMGMFLPFMNTAFTEKKFIDILLYAFIGVALVEEFCKGLMTYIIAYHQNDFDEMYDGLVYAIFVSLGFAFLENIIYVYQTSSINTALLRAISAVPSHACDAIFMGYYLSMAKLFALRKNYKLEKKNLFLSIAVPAILHGIYDFCLMSGYRILTLVFFVFIVFLYIMSHKRLKEFAATNKRIKFKNKFCHVCGKAVTGEFCAKCGAKQM